MVWPSEHPCKLPEAKPLQEINLIHPNNVGILKPIEGAENQGSDWSKSKDHTDQTGSAMFPRSEPRPLQLHLVWL
jgi:hypothetical protein